MLQITFNGNIGKDAELKSLQSNGGQFLTFSVAVKGRKKGDDSIWIDCCIWNEKQALGLHPWLKKGQHVIVTGYPSINTYMDKLNQPKSGFKVDVRDIDFAGKKSDNENNQQSNNQSSQAFGSPQGTNAPNQQSNANHASQNASNAWNNKPQVPQSDQGWPNPSF